MQLFVVTSRCYAITEFGRPEYSALAGALRGVQLPTDPPYAWVGAPRVVRRAVVGSGFYTYVAAVLSKPDPPPGGRPTTPDQIRSALGERITRALKSVDSCFAAVEVAPYLDAVNGPDLNWWAGGQAAQTRTRDDYPTLTGRLIADENPVGPDSAAVRLPSLGEAGHQIGEAVGQGVGTIVKLVVLAGVVAAVAYVGPVVGPPLLAGLKARFGSRKNPSRRALPYYLDDQDRYEFDQYTAGDDTIVARVGDGEATRDEYARYLSARQRDYDADERAYERNAAEAVERRERTRKSGSSGMLRSNPSDGDAANTVLLGASAVATVGGIGYLALSGGAGAGAAPPVVTPAPAPVPAPAPRVTPAPVPRPVPSLPATLTDAERELSRGLMADDIARKLRFWFQAAMYSWHATDEAPTGIDTPETQRLERVVQAMRGVPDDGVLNQATLRAVRGVLETLRRAAGNDPVRKIPARLWRPAVAAVNDAALAVAPGTVLLQVDSLDA